MGQMEFQVPARLLMLYRRPLIPHPRHLLSIGSKRDGEKQRERERERCAQVSVCSRVLGKLWQLGHSLAAMGGCQNPMGTPQSQLSSACSRH